MKAIMAVIVLGAWWLGANHDVERRERIVMSAHCERVYLWHIEEMQGIAEINRRGSAPEGKGLCV